MLRFVTGDLFGSKAQTLVNTVNCVGVMGKGVALAFKERYPEMYDDYRRRCEAGEIRPGVLTLYTTTPPWVLNFPTKRHWRNRSRLGDVEAGLKALAEQYKDWGIESLGIPALGCGHGGLDWSNVRPLIEKYLGPLDINVEVYEPAKAAVALADAVSSSEAPAQPAQKDLFGNEVVVPKPKKRKARKRRK